MWSELFKRFVRLAKGLFFKIRINRLKHGNRTCGMCPDAWRPKPTHEGEILPDGTAVGLGAEDGAIIPMLVEAFDRLGCPMRWDWVGLRACPTCRHGPISSRVPGSRGYLNLVEKIVLVRVSRTAVEVFFEAKSGQDPSQLPLVQTRTAIFLITRFFPDMDKPSAISALQLVDGRSCIPATP